MGANVDSIRIPGLSIFDIFSRKPNCHFLSYANFIWDDVEEKVLYLVMIMLNILHKSMQYLVMSAYNRAVSRTKGNIPKFKNQLVSNP